MKRYLKSGYPNVQDIILEPGTYTFWAYIRSEFGDTYSFRLFNGTEWEVFDIDVEMGKWTKAFEVFTVKDKKTKLDPFARYFDSEQPVFLYKPQLIKGNIPSDAGASPFDIDSIVDDLHDNIDGIADFTNEEFADRVLSTSERVSLKREMEAVESIFQSLRGSYEKLVINPYVPAIALSDLTLKYDSVMTAKTTLFNVLNLIIAGDEIVSPEEITAKDNALLTLNAALYSYNLAEKEITNALGADYTQKISAIRDFTDDEFADRMLSETEKISLSHDLDNVQTVVDSVTSRFNELLLNPFITEADRDLLVEKYNALLDAWDWDEDLDSSKPNGLKTVILNIINDPDNLIDPDEMLEKDLALSAFNLALGEFSATEVYISKIIVEYAIDQATFWSIHATAPVIYKDSRNAVTDGHHMPITVKGQLHRGTQIQDGGYITVTADEEVEATEASFSPVLISPLDHDDKSKYTIRLYDSKAKTMLLDTMTIPVVFRGASGKDAINVTLSNEIDSVPASNAGTVSSYANTGTDIRVFEGATELTYDGVGTNLGAFKVTSLGINLTVGQISTPILGILKCVIGNIANLTEDKGITQFVVSGRTLEGEAFSEVKEQTISKSKKGDTGADGDGILEVLDYYGLSSSASTLPTTWYNTVPSKGANEYLWNYERILYTDGTYDETQPRVIQGKDAKSISAVVNQYVYSTSDTVQPASGWKSTIAELGAKPEGYFLWVRDFITYTDGTTGTTNGYVVKDGTDGYSVGLTKGEHTYSYDKNGAIKGSLSDGAVSVDVYNGAKMLTCSSTGTGLPVVDDTYRVTAIALSPLSKLTYNVAISSNNYKLTPTGITADEVEVIFTIVARTKGINTSFTRTVRYKKIQDGADGDGITSTTIHYAKSSSGTTPPTSGWSTSIPSPTVGRYLWTRTTTTYKKSATTESYSISYWAEDGDGIVSTTIHYAKSSSGTTPPTSGWATSLPSVTLGWYLWTRTTTVYKKSPTTEAYSVSRYAKDGDPGTPGSPGTPGANGKGVSSVVIWYYKSSSATTQTGGSWSTTKPTYSASFYLWTKTITTYTDNSTSETTPIIDPDWHKVMAITDKFGTTIDGGLVTTVMMLLREFNSETVTSGISGIQGVEKDAPSYWSGGTHAQAQSFVPFVRKLESGQSTTLSEYNNLPKNVFLHDGSAKVGHFIALKSGEILIIDPNTGSPKLRFTNEDLRPISDLVTGVNTSGSTAIGAGTTSFASAPNSSSVKIISSRVVTGSTSVAKVGSVGTFDGSVLTLSATGKKQASGISSHARAILYLRRNGARVNELASVSIDFLESVYTNKYNSSVKIKTYPYLYNGTHTFELVIEIAGDVPSGNASSSASNFSWAHTVSGVREQQYGKDGMMFFYSNNHFHYTENGGLDIKGAINMPGLLFSGSVNSGGGFASWWGAKKHASLNATRQGAGTYAVYHSVGHTNYQVSITPSSNRTFYIGTKNTNFFIVYFYTNASSPSLSDTNFDFQITGNNY